MLYFVAIAVGMVLGILVKGKLSNLFDLRLEKKALVFAAVIIQTMAQVLASKGFTPAVRYSYVTMSTVFFLMLLVYWYNRHYAGIWVIGVGSLLNVLVMMLNGGKMPVSIRIMEKAGLGDFIELLKTGGDGKHILMDDGTKLAFLGDIMHPPDGFNWMLQVVSIGDVLVILGIAVMIFEVVGGLRFNPLKVKFNRNERL